VDPLVVATALAAPAATVRLSLTAILAAEAMTSGAPTTGLAGELPRSPGSTLVLRLNQETVHDFILLFMPPCGPHLTPLATGSLE
jgi:hypothetical protein